MRIRAGTAASPGAGQAPPSAILQRMRARAGAAQKPWEEHYLPEALVCRMGLSNPPAERPPPEMCTTVQAIAKQVGTLGIRLWMHFGVRVGV